MFRLFTWGVFVSDVHVFIDDFLAALGLHCCAWASSSGSEAGLPLWCSGFSLRGLLLGSVWALLVAAHRLGGCRSRAPGHRAGAAMLRFSCSAAGRLFLGQGLNLSVFPALAGGTAKEVQMSMFLI